MPRSSKSISRMDRPSRNFPKRSRNYNNMDARSLWSALPFIPAVPRRTLSLAPTRQRMMGISNPPPSATGVYVNYLGNVHQQVGSSMQRLARLWPGVYLLRQLATPLVQTGRPHPGPSRRRVGSSDPTPRGSQRTNNCRRPGLINCSVGVREAFLSSTTSSGVPIGREWHETHSWLTLRSQEGAQGHCILAPIRQRR